MDLSAAVFCSSCGDCVMSLNSNFKGWLGELKGLLAHRLLLDRRVYHSLHDVTLPTPEGTTQIDHILVSRFGVFVIEAKNFEGWIFGSEHSAQWTQNLYEHKSRFQNLLHQNYRHTQALSEYMRLPQEKLHSLVMFWGDCTFKTPLPHNVINKGYIR